MLRCGERLGTGADVLLEAAAETGDDRPLDLLGDGRDSGEVAGGAVGEAGLDDVDTEPCQLVGDGQLVLGAEGHARRLLAVAQRGVEDGERLQLLRSPLHEERIAETDRVPAGSARSPLAAYAAPLVGSVRAGAHAPVLSTVPSPSDASTSSMPGAVLAPSQLIFERSWAPTFSTG